MQDNNKSFNHNIALWLVIAMVLGLVYMIYQGTGAKSTQIQRMDYSDFVTQVGNGQISSVTIRGQKIQGFKKDNTKFITYAPEDAQVSERLLAQRVSVNAEPEETPGLFKTMLIQVIPFALVILIWFFIMRQMQGSGGRGAMSFGKSRARMLNESSVRVTFSDVAGIDEAREELQEIVDFLKDPAKFQRLGGKIPKGALLVGSPGTGKTLLAKAIAGEANVPFFSISGSDFVEMFVGVGASRVRDMFEQAKKNSPCIVFIDEIDAVGRHRGAGLGGGNDEREQTLNQLLVEMDGFDANEGVIIISATNRPDVLDPALLRPGRFDRQIVVPRPDIIGREKILLVHMAKVPTASDVRARDIARGTPGFSGADLANLINEAALLAARKNKRLVSMADFEEAKDKVLMGSARKSMVMTDDEKKATAYHEAGHALVSMHVPHSDPLHKVTIIPRGRALGVTWNLPERDRYSMTLQQMQAKLALCFGGRIAEQLIYGKEELNTGASNDIQQATEMARAMVMEYGMSEKLGWLRYANNQEEVFLGHSVARTQNISAETARLIDEEVRRIVEESKERARKVLNDHIDQLHLLAKALLEYETLSGTEADDVINGKDIRGSSDDASKPQGDEAQSSTIPRSGQRSKPETDSSDPNLPEPQPTT